MPGFTKQQIKEANEARSLYPKVGYLSWNDYPWAVQSNQIKNCPVTVEAVDNAMEIWGKNIAELKGKTVRRKPKGRCAKHHESTRADL